MSGTINFKREITSEFDAAIERTANALQRAGFGVLTRIDLHAKIKEKIGKDIAKVVILGACNPALAYEAYTANSDVASLLPCNAVVRDLGGSKISIELAKPSALMRVLGDEHLVRLAVEADQRLERALLDL